jgi:DNA repair protein RadC
MPYPQIHVTVKYKGRKCQQSPILDNGDDAARVIREICNQHTILWVEELLMLCLNAGNRLLGWYRVCIGGIDRTIADIRVIATIAAISTASRVILAHNHPCGKLKPSIQDLQTTAQIKTGLRTIGVDLVDHIIITDCNHISLKDGGFL